MTEREQAHTSHPLASVLYFDTPKAFFSGGMSNSLFFLCSWGKLRL